MNILGDQTVVSGGSYSYRCINCPIGTARIWWYIGDSTCAELAIDKPFTYTFSTAGTIIIRALAVSSQGSPFESQSISVLVVKGNYHTISSNVLENYFKDIRYLYPDAPHSSKVDEYLHDDTIQKFFSFTTDEAKDSWNEIKTINLKSMGYELPNLSSISGIVRGTKPQFNLIKYGAGSTSTSIAGTYPLIYIYKNHSGKLTLRHFSIDVLQKTTTFIDKTPNLLDGCMCPTSMLLFIQGAGGGGGGRHKPFLKYGGDGGGSGGTWGAILNFSDITTSSGYLISLGSGGAGAENSWGSSGKSGGDSLICWLPDPIGENLSKDTVSYDDWMSVINWLMEGTFTFCISLSGGGTSDNTHPGYGGKITENITDTTRIIDKLCCVEGSDGGTCGAWSDVTKSGTDASPGGAPESKTVYCTKNTNYRTGKNVLTLSQSGGSAGIGYIAGGGGAASLFYQGGAGAGIYGSSQSGAFGSGGGGANSNYGGGAGGNGALFLYY